MIFKPFHSQSPSGQTSNVICGENSGQHIYVDIGPDSGASASVSMSFGTNTASVSRSWEIKVSFISHYVYMQTFDNVHFEILGNANRMLVK